MQTATILYNDRINTFRMMKKLDEQLETEPTEQAVAEMAELRIRNLQTFAELQSFNDTGRFLCRHPLLFGRSELAQLQELFHRNVPDFMRRYKNTLDNIKRYRSYLKRDDRKTRRDSDRELLDRHIQRERLFRMVMDEAGQADAKHHGQ